MYSPAETSATAEPQPPFSQATRVQDWRLPPQQRKESLLPLIVQLALEGESGRAIARKMELPERTVNHWLREVRREWFAKAAAGTAETLALGLARLDAVYREAMQAWRDSQREMQVELFENTEGDDGRAKKKRSVRTQTQRRNTACLGKAIDAVKTTFLLKGHAARLRTEAGSRDSGLIPVAEMLPEDFEALTENDLEHMNDDERRALVARCEAEIVASGETVPTETTDEDLKHMSDVELQAATARCKSEIADEEEKAIPAEPTEEDLEPATDEESQANGERVLAQIEAIRAARQARRASENASPRRAP